MYLVTYLLLPASCFQKWNPFLRFPCFLLTYNCRPQRSKNLLSVRTYLNHQSPQDTQRFICVMAFSSNSY